MLLAAVATLVGASVQSATGFGFALVLGPALFAALDPSHAVTVLLVVGAVLNCLVLFAEGARPRVRGRDLGLLLVAAVPGLVAGALLLAELPKATMQIAVGIAVLVAAAFQLSAQRRRAAAPARLHASPAAAAALGAGTGLLTTTTSINGPPLVLWLLHRGAEPAELRDSLAAAFLVLNVLGAAALFALADAGADLDPVVLAVLLPATVAGHLAGRTIFRRLDPTHFRLAALGLVVAAGAASLAAGLAG